MTKPWEKYATAKRGPWDNYAQPAPAEAALAAEAPAAPEQPNTWGQAIKNVGQGLGHFTTSALGSVGGDVAGLTALLAPPAMIARGLGYDADWNDPAAVRDKVSSALTYTPENKDTLTMKMVTAPGKVMQGASEFLSRKTDEATGGVPYLGNLAGSIPTVAANLLGAKGATLTKGVKVPAGKMGNLGAEAIYKEVPNASGAALAASKVPSTEELTAAAKKAYADAKESGVVVPAKSYGTALGKVRKLATEEGIDPTLHPKSTAVMKRMDEMDGKDLTLQEAETLRKIALDAEDDLNPVTRAPTPDSRLAGKIVDQLDESIDALSLNSPARKMWARSRRSQMIDQMIKRAEIKAGAQYTQAGMEHALRTEFKQLALNPRRMRGLNAEQRAAIEKVAKGGTAENILRALGKFDPTTSVVSAAGSIGTSALLYGINPAAAGLPIAGIVGRRLATKMTEKNVAAAREALVGRAPANAGAPLEQAATPPAMPQQAGLGGMPAPAAAAAPALPETAAAPPAPAAVPPAIAGRALRGAERAPAEIRAELQQLEAAIGRLTKRPADVETGRLLRVQMERLRTQLAVAEARGAVR